MRFIVYGAGAIGATIGGRLQKSGQSVTLIARGAHAQAMRAAGLRLRSHDGSERLDLPVVEHPSEIRFTSDDLVLLAVKTQDAVAALDDLAACAPPDIAILCAQNGVEGERIAMRRFARVYGISVMCPAVFLEPGKVQAFGTPVIGILDVGRYPSGTDELCARIAEAFCAAKLDSKVRDQILRFKYGKLLFNLGNAIEVVCEPAARQGPIGELVKREAIAALSAAGISFDADEAASRAQGVSPKPFGAAARPGGSSWQSLMRRTGNIETDYLNGEIVLVGRLAGVPTPANALLQRLSNEMARARQPPGLMTQEQFLARLP
jgi:2-dehydropantoate 2-reductase